MIITKTPYRISFCGGGTDIREFYQNEFGMVISSTIDKYLYVVVRKPLGLVESKYRINYRIVEFCDSIDEIKHPIVRETLRYFDINMPLEITTFADIPASTGLGSSSAFAVGLVSALSGITGKLLSKMEMARIASFIEIEVLGRKIGKQDHYASSFGGINIIRFDPDESVFVNPIPYSQEMLSLLNSWSMLFYTGQTRDASAILEKQVANTKAKFDHLVKLKNQVPLFANLLADSKNTQEMGRILSEGWKQKKSLTPEISNSKIDELYEKAMIAGASGGKLLGAGGGGFLLFLADPRRHEKIREELNGTIDIQFNFEKEGTRISYYESGI